MDCFFDSLQNMSSMLSDDQKKDLKEMGEKFYRDIDMEKYRPVPTEEAVSLEELVGVEFQERLQVQQIQKALDSGLQWDDLSEDEQLLLKKYAMQV